jgi:hypothetical protein
MAAEEAGRESRSALDGCLTPPAWGFEPAFRLAGAPIEAALTAVHAADPALMLRALGFKEFPTVSMVFYGGPSPGPHNSACSGGDGHGGHADVRTPLLGVPDEVIRDAAAVGRRGSTGE